MLYLLGDINNDGDKILVARGGPGGRPENNYIGTKGHIMSVRLDLKLIADIGLVGCVINFIFNFS